jgi:ribosome-binding factor A
MTERTARLDELLREEISEVVRREIDDPRIGFVTVTDVEVSPDLRHASVWVSVIGSTEQRREALRALSRAMPFVRSRLGRLRLKRIPELHVKEDQTAERGTRVLRILEALEGGGTADLPETEETLPTPTGMSALEPVDESGEAPPKRRRRPRGRR